MEKRIPDIKLNAAGYQYFDYEGVRRTALTLQQIGMLLHATVFSVSIHRKAVKGG